MFDERRNRWLVALVAAATCASLTDGAFAMRGVLASHASMGSALRALGVASLLVWPPFFAGGAALAAVIAAAERACGARRLAAALFGGHARLAAGLLVALLGLLATNVAIVGRAIIGRFHADAAAAAIVVLALSGAAAVVIVTTAAMRAAGPLLARAERRWPSLRGATTGDGSAVLFVAAAALTLDALLPRPFAVAPAAALVAAVLARGAAWRRWRPRRDLAAAGAALLVLFGAPNALARLPGRARLAVVQSAPYGSILMSVVHRFVDDDHDGYSPLLDGGDCDDHDPSVHPGAYDVPGNGRDENCSGEDALAEDPPAPPRGSLPAGVPSRPNVIVLLVDALRPDRLGFAGNPRSPSPNLDALARRAVWFRRAYAPAPSTRYALASLFTGLDVASLPRAPAPPPDLVLRDDAVTLAERLDEAAYERVGFTIPYVLQHMRGMGQGFQTWTAPGAGRCADDALGCSAAYTTDAVLARVASDRPSARPYFLFAHYACTHWPYERRGDSTGGPLEMYDDAVALCDAEIGRVLRAVDASPDAARTVVAVVSDHGELLGEHGLTQHGTSLLEPAVRDLLLVHVPGVAPRVVDTPVLLTDLNPLVVQLAGGDPVGWSLAAHLAGDLAAAASPPGRPLLLYADDWRAGVHYVQRAVVDDRWKLIRDLPTGVELLFDVEDDPAEGRNRRRGVEAVRARLHAWLDRRDASPDGRAP